MKYCGRLFKELNFEPAYLSPCCNTHNLHIPKMPYKGGKIDLNAYGEYISNVFEEIQQGKESCKGCPELRDIDHLPGFNGKFGAISLNMHRYFCNCKCVYCNFWKGGTRERCYEVLPGLKSLKEQGALENNARISWGGGEPAILPEFNNAAQWLLQNGYDQYIHSNAIRYSPVISDALANGKAMINISLDSGGAETYKRVKGVDCFDKVAGNIQAYARANPEKVELKYIIFEKNNDIDEIRRFMDLATNAGIGNLQFSFDFREQNAGKISPKSFMAAAFMLVLAQERHVALTPFYVDGQLMERIGKYVDAILA